MTTYNFPTHVKGDTFKARQITLGFDITGAEIKMQFKLSGSIQPSFEWSTVDNSFTVSNASTGVIVMTKKILDFNPASYVYDLQIEDSNGDVATHFKGSLTIEQDITV
jgi:hypothetical protein